MWERYDGRIGGKALYADLRAGDESAWTFLYAWVLRRTQNALRDHAVGAAEEVAQEFLLRLHEHGLGLVKSPAGFYGFLKTSLRRAVVDFLRKEWRTVNPDPEGPEVVDGEGHRLAHRNPSPSPEEIANWMSVLRAVARLTGRCREILTTFIRVTMEGGSQVEAADLLGIARASIHTLLRRCLEQFHALSAPS